MASRREEHQEDVRLHIVRLIDKNSRMSSRQITDKVGIDSGSAYYVLTALIEKSFVKLGNFKSNPRKGKDAYLLTPKGIREKSLLAHRFIGLKRQEFDALGAEIESLEKETGLAKDINSSDGSIK